jgi:3-methylcrotonyl-CoA carboxylase alpha subunit
MGIRTVAIGSVADKSAMHMKLAHEAAIIGNAEVADSYLNIQKIISVAQKFEVDAIHPGYGFLSENADFAEAVHAAGITFIGPSSKAIRLMGSKSEAKVLADKLKIPTIPGYQGEDQTLGRLHAEAESIGYPLLIKATYGGGGKGMRRVDQAEDFYAALAGCQREAQNAFGNSAVLLEKYISHPRHIEVQIMGNKHKQYLAISERDCSLQRRHQKVIEEAPAASLSQSLRETLWKESIALAQAVKYEGAGTVEFLVDQEGKHYFLEMNTRLQVEHPVTEMVTGLDLVEWQIRAAAGEMFPCAQKDIQVSGHAIEARLYAEDPDNHFLPSIGRLTEVSFPPSSPMIRIDSGVQSGDEITIHYDPMIAKIIAWGKNREIALQTMSQALAMTTVKGVKTNLRFLQSLMHDPIVQQDEIDIGYLDRRSVAEKSDNPFTTQKSYILAALWLQTQSKGSIHEKGGSPWHMMDGWQLNTHASHDVAFLVDGKPQFLNFFLKDHAVMADFGGTIFEINSYQVNEHHVWALIEGKSYKAYVAQDDHHVDVYLDRHHERIVLSQPFSFLEQDQQESHLNAPMPGRIINILAEVGQSLDPGDPILIMEAMKMEHTIRSSVKGILEAVHYTVGDFVEEGTELAVVGSAHD